MTALDVFRRCAAADREIEGLKEKIERREALATGRTARPLSPDGGGRGSGDASMRLVDYVANIEELRAKLVAREAQKKSDMACAIYLAEGMPPSPPYGRILISAYVDRMSLKAIAEEMNYSQTQARRLKQQAEEMAANLVITYWDGNHVPLTVYRQR